MIKAFISSTFTGLFTRKMNFYYAVANGRRLGVYHTWDDCKAQIHQFSGAIFKKFRSKEEAEDFIQSRSKISSKKSSTSKAPSKSLLDVFPMGRKTSHSKRFFSTEESDDSPQSSKRRKKSFSDYKTSTESNKLEEDNKGFINVWTDGACSKNGTSGARAGIGVWFGDYHPLNVSRPVHERNTNNFAEIEAVKVAADQAKSAGTTKIRIHTDSEFLIKSMTVWMPNWKRNGWKNSTGQEVKNKTELERLDLALRDFKCVEWNHVRGHAGNHGNEMADHLAREGAKQHTL